MVRKPARRADLVTTALQADRPTRWIEFTREFDPHELIKDIAAIANSGGGVIVVGVDRRGNPTGWDPAALLATDVAGLVAAHIGEPWNDVEVAGAIKAGQKIATVLVGGRTLYPLVFAKQTNAFAKGTVYFRHGTRSEPAVARDLARFATAEIARHRKELLHNIRKLSAAPEGAEIIVATPTPGPAGTVDRFRVVDDPHAPAVARTDFDVTHPYRQKELVNTLNDRFGATIVGPYEILAVRRVHGIDDEPEFFHRPKFGSPQYSEAFVSWLTAQHHRDPEFFVTAKEAYKASRA